MKTIKKYWQLVCIKCGWHGDYNTAYVKICPSCRSHGANDFNVISGTKNELKEYIRNKGWTESGRTPFPISKLKENFTIREEIGIGIVNYRCMEELINKKKIT